MRQAGLLRPHQAGAYRVDYRREIDGLRAVAILPVVFFHAGVDLFPGGYVGVVSFLVVQSTTRPTGQAGTGES